MLIHLSNDMYVNSEKITYIYKRLTPESTWAVHLGVGDQVILSQAHFDELMACLPSPVEASKIVEAKQAADSSEIQAYNLMIRALGGKP